MPEPHPIKAMRAQHWIGLDASTLILLPMITITSEMHFAQRYRPLVRQHVDSCIAQSLLYRPTEYIRIQQTTALVVQSL
jgi:hypothetical protein